MNQTLGQYFAELRRAVVPFPRVTREMVEATGDTELSCELVHRRWRTSRKARKVARNTRDEWSAYFLRKQQARCGLSMDKVAERAGCDTVTVSKIERDRSVKAATVCQVMERGLGFAPDSPETRRALVLLTARSVGGKMEMGDLQKEIASVQNRQSFNQFLERVVPILATIPAKDYNAVLEAPSNPATVKTLGTFNKLAATTEKSKLHVMSKIEPS